MECARAAASSLRGGRWELLRNSTHPPTPRHTPHTPRHTPLPRTPHAHEPSSEQRHAVIGASRRSNTCLSSRTALTHHPQHLHNTLHSRFLHLRLYNPQFHPSLSIHIVTTQYVLRGREREREKKKHVHLPFSCASSARANRLTLA